MSSHLAHGHSNRATGSGPDEFESNGYSIHSSAISEHECDAILGELDLFRSSPGQRRLIESKTIQAIAQDCRLISIASRYISGEPVPFKATFFNKTEDFNWLVPWHQDRVLPIKRRKDLPGWGPWTNKDGIEFAHAPTWALSRVIALRLHLDSSTTFNGPLRVIPGSHTLGVLDQAQVVNVANKDKRQTLTVSKGGVIAIRPLTIHASSKSLNNLSRRVLHFEYTDSLRLSDGIELTYC